MNKKFSQVTKLKAIILYMLQKGVLQEREDISETIIRFSNMLYLIDMESYRLTGKSITGSTYVKHEGGAIPLGIATAFNSLVKLGYLRVISFAEYMSSVSP